MTPACANGDHHDCNGRAWDISADRPMKCICHHHDYEEPNQ